MKDCLYDGAGGCKGSVTQLGFNYLQLFGMMSDADYPYVSGDTSDAETCVYDPSLTQAWNLSRPIIWAVFTLHILFFVPYTIYT